jgi:hypothetical protein
MRLFLRMLERGFGLDIRQFGLSVGSNRSVGASNGVGDGQYHQTTKMFEAG